MTGKKVNYQLIGDRWINVERFRNLSKFNPKTNCIEWQGPKNNAGYGLNGHRLNNNGEMMSGGMMTSHRTAWMIANNSAVPAGQHIHHTCHNRLCLTPEHLQLGNHSDKMKTMWEEGIHGFQLTESIQDRTDWHRHYDNVRRYSVEDIQFCRSQTIPEIQQRFNLDDQKARNLKGQCRQGYKWLPFDREATKQPPRKQS